MTESSLFTEIKRVWAAAGLGERSGVPETAIVTFNQRYGAALPDDLAEFFRTVDGMNVGEYDDQQIRFWQLAEVKPIEQELRLATTSDLEGYFVFADYSIWAHGYAIRLAGASRNEVAIVGGKTPIRVAGSFMEFLQTYLRDPRSLF